MAKRGRPAKEPTPEERLKVKELVADKAPLADIAKLLGRSIPTLRKYFRKEILSEKKSAAAELKVTPAMREKVVRYIGCKMSPEQVARAIDITVEQLEANFKEEITTGQAKCRAKVLDQLHEQAKDGAIGALKMLEAITAIPDGSPAAPGAHLGKKQAANAAAHAAAGAGGRFAPPPGPKLVVDNRK